MASSSSSSSFIPYHTELSKEQEAQEIVKLRNAIADYYKSKNIRYMYGLSLTPSEEEKKKGQAIDNEAIKEVIRAKYNNTGASLETIESQIEYFQIIRRQIRETIEKQEKELTELRQRAFSDYQIHVTKYGEQKDTKDYFMNNLYYCSYCSKRFSKPEDVTPHPHWGTKSTAR
ncbi:MAG TPA: hypothetical protein VJ729_16505 [Nitrososphaeraceae archaeon]|nr:hypothetical protein [Nitrososphaeraceae archaeon]